MYHVGSDTQVATQRLKFKQRTLQGYLVNAICVACTVNVADLIQATITAITTTIVHKICWRDNKLERGKTYYEPISFVIV